MRIEQPTVDDADEIADLWVDLALGQREHGSHLLASQNRAEIREAIVRHTVAGRLLVARVDEDAEIDRDDGADGSTVGFVMFDQETGRYEQAVTRGVIRNLYVRPAFRRRGIGSALLSAAEDALREEVAVVGLEVMAANKDARRFYREYGYEPHRIELEHRVKNDTHSRDEG